MSRSFKTADYDATLDVTVRLGDCLLPDHLARFVVDTIAQLDLSVIYTRYGPRGGQPYAPEILLALLFYGYATGVFSTRKLERATYETVPFRFIAGNLHPDHDTLATFRRTFLPELKDLFVQVLLLAQEAGVLKLTTISLDGTKIHADASKSKAVSYQRLLDLEGHLRAEVEALFVLADREAKERRPGRRRRGRPPAPPTPGPRAKGQYNFTAPASRIMKNSTDQGFDQHDHAQVAVEQASLLIVGHSLSPHANDQAEVVPTVEAIPAAVGVPTA